MSRGGEGVGGGGGRWGGGERGGEVGWGGRWWGRGEGGGGGGGGGREGASPMPVMDWELHYITSAVPLHCSVIPGMLCEIDNMIR